MSTPQTRFGAESLPSTDGLVVRVGAGQLLATRGLAFGGAAATREERLPARLLEWATVPDVAALADPHLLTSLKLLRPNSSTKGWWCPCTQV
jgi:hypothetical protein